MNPYEDLDGKPIDYRKEVYYPDSVEVMSYTYEGEGPKPGFATINITGNSSTEIPIVFFPIEDIKLVSGREIKGQNLAAGFYRRTAQRYVPSPHDLLMNIRITHACHGDDSRLVDTIDIHPSKLILTSIVKMRHCFKCNIYYHETAFKRDGRQWDKATILSEICERCYRKTINKVREYDSIARKNGGQTPLTASQWLEKLKTSQGHCYYCKKHIGYPDLLMEHMNPLSRGGDNSIENIVPACNSCNSSKGSRTVKEWKRDELAAHLLDKLMTHYGLGKFDTVNLAVKHLAIHEGLHIEDEEVAE